MFEINKGINCFFLNSHGNNKRVLIKDSESNLSLHLTWMLLQSQRHQVYVEIRRGQIDQWSWLSAPNTCVIQQVNKHKTDWRIFWLQTVWTFINIQWPKFGSETMCKHLMCMNYDSYISQFKPTVWSNIFHYYAQLNVKRRYWFLYQQGEIQQQSAQTLLESLAD